MAEKKTGKKVVRRVLNYKWIVKNTGFFLFVALLMVFYIANGHYADKTIRNISKTGKEIKELEFEYKTLKSEMMFKSRETEMIRAAAPLGLKINDTPPLRLKQE